ncbi:MAG: hypothetical protein AAF433_05895 [Bacteroidota bacterium]
MNQQRESAGEEFLLQHCLRQIEQHLDWGDSRFWSNRDFTELSDRILDKTGVSLSPTTLKRVWGRLQYSSRPSLSTLDTLANFLDYDHWRAYKLTAKPIFKSTATPTGAPIKVDKSKTESSSNYRLVIGLGLLGAILGFTGIWWFSPAVANEVESLQAADYHFNFRTLAEGLPNTVIFDYDASAAPVDSVFIQQSWDDSRRKQVSREGHQHAAIYYKPGFFLAKLLVDSTIVQERELYIRSEDWSCIVEQRPIPVYFPKEVTHADGLLQLPPAAIEEQGLSLKPQPPVVTFSKVPSLSQPLYSDHFRLKTRLRHDYRDGAAICQYARLLILLKDGVFIIPLAQAGCVADLNLYLPGRQFAGHSNDLSGFGLDVQEWVDLEIEVVDNRVVIYVANHLAFSASLLEDPKEIIGIRYQFEGTGSVQSLAIWGKDEANPVWEDNFGFIAAE